MLEASRPFKVWLPVTGIFILAGLYILIFSFVVDVKCPNDITSDSCNEYMKAKRVQKISPFIISYGFLFVALMFWCYYWWNTTREEINEKIRMEEIRMEKVIGKEQKQKKITDYFLSIGQNNDGDVN